MDKAMLPPLESLASWWDGKGWEGSGGDMKVVPLLSARAAATVLTESVAEQCSTTAEWEELP